MTQLSRRGLIGALICAPAIVRASSLMPVKPWGQEFVPSRAFALGDVVFLGGVPLGVVTSIVNPAMVDVAISSTGGNLRLFSGGLQRQ